MKLKNPETKDQLIQRLRRIEGQVRGVQGMLDGERDCHEIMQQLSAVRSAVQSVSRVFLQEYATECLLEPDEEPEARQRREKVIHDMITMLDKAP
jgi:CsoR family transcriptional regulator, copper-sensing transcriptional repressor